MDIEELLSDLREEARWGNIKCGKAADEIERLQEALRAINRKNDNPAWFNPDIHEIVEAALQQKESE